MTRNCVSLAVICASVFISNTVFAVSLGNGFDLDLELTATSDYRYFGISQSQGDPALQAGATLSSPIGAYIGTWVSSVDFGSTADSKLEQDYFAGWFIPVGEDFLLDVGWLKYTYQKNSELNQSGYYLNANYKGLAVDFQYSDDLFGNQTNTYTALSYEYPFNDSTRLNVRYGMMDFKDEAIFSADGDSRSKYFEWEARVEKDYWGATWKASLMDTDLSASECMSISGYDDLCSADVILSVSKHF